MTPEGKVVAFLVRRCKELGLHQRKLAYEGRRGAPDRLIVGFDCFAMIEVKAPGQKPRREQVREIEVLRNGGIPVYVCDSTDAVEGILLDLRERTDTNRLFALREGPQW